MSENDFSILFDRLKALLVPYASSLNVIDDQPDKYYLETGYSEKWKKPLFFGSAIVQKNYVSFYLMPVYMYPELLKGISPELQKRMQGKSCFNFKSLIGETVGELEKLAGLGVERLKSEENR